MGAGSNLLRKFLVTLASGGLGYLITTFAEQPTIWALTMSIFIGGVSLVVQFLVDVDGRIDAMSGRFRTVNAATALFGRVDASDLRTDTVVDLVETSTRIAELKSPLLIRFINDEMLRLTEVIRQLVVQGSASHPGDAADWMLSLTSQAERTIQATTMVGPGSVDEGFWLTQLAETYLEAQREAVVQRNVKVQRLFIVPASMAGKREFEDIIRRNLDAAIEVRVYAGTPMRGLLEFIIFDGEICQEFPSTQVVSGEPILSVVQQLRLEPHVVTRRVNQFDRWWSLGEPRLYAPTTPEQ